MYKNSFIRLPNFFINIITLCSNNYLSVCDNNYVFLDRQMGVMYVFTLDLNQVKPV